MKMDNHHRVTIPKFVRDMLEIKESEYYYFNFEEDNKFSIRKFRGGKIIERVKVDANGRFVIPASISDVFDSKKIIIYAEEEIGQVGISILKEDA